jgi:serine/threonine protein kinase
VGLERGATIGPYRVLFRLGSGGMGEVWRATDTKRGLEVAIKVLSPESARDEDRMRRFAMESKAASALRHPNILTVHEVGTSDAGPYLVTEYVEGSTVRNLLNEGPMPVARAVDVALQAAEGVASAHSLGMVHRDLKPENLMVNRDGVVKILDFGLAKLLNPTEEEALNAGRTATGMIIGTAGYLSPEQLRGEKASERSDVFALGVVLYEMLAGDNPFRRNNPVETFSAILREDPPALGAKLDASREELSAVISRALAKSPADRYATAAELAADLRSVQAKLAPAAVAAPEPERSAGSRTAVIAAVVVLVLAVGGFLLMRGC